MAVLANMAAPAAAQIFTSAQAIDITRIRNRKTGRCSSWDTTGRNRDLWTIPAGQSRVLADIKGPAVITHIWMTQSGHGTLRERLLKITYDGATYPSVLVPVGDFFCLGHGIVNSFQSALFSASTANNYRFSVTCGLNCYVPMPFKQQAIVELINESAEDHNQYFYIDYETLEDEHGEDIGYFHAEFRRANPFGGWAPEIHRKQVTIANKNRTAWENNYVILETKGRGHYIGCNLSVTNLQGTWWGEGDDMIWVDGYKWPPDLHGTGTEDYFGHASGMHENAYSRHGSSVFEEHTRPAKRPGDRETIGPGGGYQTSYVFHLENPVRFQKEIKVTMEHGHGNSLCNEMSSAAYWYAEKPTRIVEPPAVAKRMPVLADNQGNWMFDRKNQCPGRKIKPNAEMLQMKKKWAREHGG